MHIKRPMLAATATEEQLEQLEYPLLVSPKLDGIRTLIHPELGPVSRKFKQIPNHYLRKCLNRACLSGFDGELVATGGTFNSTQSAVMRYDGEPEAEFWVFDDFSNPDESFLDRSSNMMNIFDGRTIGVDIRFVSNHWVETPEELKDFASMFVSQGYEGAMIRSPYGKYKQGRSTLKQGWLLKFKDFADAEGVITGFEELMHNDNVLEQDELGYAKRSSAKDGKKGRDTLGALIVSTDWGELRIGTGYDQATRDSIWQNRDQHMGRTVTFKYQSNGMQDKPRFPVFMHFRED